MKKLLLLVIVLLTASSMTFAQNFNYSQLPKELRDQLTRISVKASEVKLANHVSHGKGMVKHPTRAISIQWDDVNNTWATDSSIQYYTWSSNGTPVEAYSYSESSGQQIKSSYNNFTTVSGDMLGDRFLVGYFPQQIDISVKVVNSWIPVYRIKFSFDANSNMTQVLQQQYQIAWNDVSKVDYVYDSHQNLTSEENYSWDGNAWVLSDGSHNTLTYNGNFVSEIAQESYVTDSMGNSAWTSTNTEIYTLNPDGSVKTAVRYAYDDANGTWMILDSIGNIVWKSFDGKVTTEGSDYLLIGGSNYISYDQYYDGGTGWFHGAKSSKTYNSNDLATSELYEEYDGSNWVNSTMREWTYYSNNDLKSNIFSEWNNSQWEATDEAYYDNTYDVDGDITGSVEDYQNMGSSYYKVKNVYEYGPVTGIAPVSSVSVKAYPNPATNYLVVSGMKAGNVQVQLFDLAGKSVISNTINANGELRLDVSAIPAGQYILSVSSADAQHIMPILKN